MIRTLCCLLAFSALYAAVGDTRIATWSGDKEAAIILMFDDSLPSQAKNVVPLLKERGLTGSFYINPAAWHYKQHKETWEKTVPAAGMELGNHTMTHKGITDPNQIEAEIGACNEIIHQATPDLPWPRPISWAKPGVKKEQWTLSSEDMDAALKTYQLQTRPSFSGRGASIAFKTSGQMLAHVDKAVSKQAMECIIFHGVGGDWLSVPTEMFRELVDGLQERADKVWVCTHGAALAYAANRNASTCTADAKRNAITVNLQSTTEAAITAQALTLITSVQPGWKRCVVSQGDSKIEVDVTDGNIIYEAQPKGGQIRIAKR